MKLLLTYLILGALALAQLIAKPLYAQTVLTAPYVAGCPSGKDNACKYQFYPLTDTTHWLASGSKTNPSYAHTYSGYAPTPTALLVACPKGATLSADSKACTAGGVDASQLVAYSLLPTFSTVVPPLVQVRDYPVNWSAPSVDGYLVQHSTDAGKTWDSGVTVSASTGSYTFKSLPTNVTQCFQVSTLSKAYGNSDPTVTCVPSGTTLAPAGLTAAPQ